MGNQFERTQIKNKCEVKHKTEHGRITINGYKNKGKKKIANTCVEFVIFILPEHLY